jgi:hypothetical protein
MKQFFLGHFPGFRSCVFAAAIGRRLVSTNARMAGPKLTLYVDTVSPFSYEAYYILRVSSGHSSSLGRG